MTENLDQSWHRSRRYVIDHATAAGCTCATFPEVYVHDIGGPDEWAQLVHRPGCPAVYLPEGL